MSETVWVVAELIATVAMPAVALIWLTDDAWLGPAVGLVVALLPPLLWSLVSVVRERRVSALGVIATVSVLLTGGVGLFELDVRWFAFKEAAVPAALGVAAIVSARTRFAVFPIVLDRLLDPERLGAALAEDEAAAAFDAASRRGTVAMGAVMLVSSIGTFLLARYVVQSASGTKAFGAELGRFTALSFPVVGIPVMLAMGWVLWRFVLRLEAAGVDLEDLMRKPAGARSKSEP